MRTSPQGYCTHLPGPGSYPRGWGPGRRLACARREWGSSQRGARRSLGRRAERSGGQGSRLLPQGRATLGRQTQDKIKREHHKAETVCGPRPRDPQEGAEPPGRWGAPGRPSRTFSVHRRAGGRGSERTGTECIPFSNPLSRGSLRAASYALSFASLCHSYMGARLCGGTVAATTFWDANAPYSFPMTDGEGEMKKERKKTNKKGGNVQESLLQIQISLGFHSGESLRWCLRRLTSHFRVGGGVGAGAGVRALAPLHERERYAAGVAVPDATAAPKRASRAVGSAEKRCCCVRSAWAAECAGSGVGCSLTPCCSLLLCHWRGRRSRAEPSPGLDCAKRTLLLQPRLLWLASSPTRRRAAVSVCEPERARRREKLRAVAAGGALTDWSAPLPSTTIARPRRVRWRSRRRRHPQKPSPCLPSPPHLFLLGGKNLGQHCRALPNQKYK